MFFSVDFANNQVLKRLLVRLAAGTMVLCFAASAWAAEPIPDKVVVLTFDDSVKSHFTVVGPILKQHGFGATFFITEGFEFKTNKLHYMTWEEIARLHADGFEIGNHTRDHMGITKDNLEQVAEQVEAINRRCEEYGIPRTVTLAYPGNAFDPEALPVLKQLGIRLARRGGSPEYAYKDGKGFAYEPALDHPLLIPSAGDARPFWTLDNFRAAVEQARFGRIAVLQFHGVPDLAHRHVHCPVERFREFMQYLDDNGYTVLSLRDLERYADPNVTPSNPLGVIRDRQQCLANGTSCEEGRTPQSDDELRSWLENMVWHHRFTVPEICKATGMTAEEVTQALARFDIRPETKPPRDADAPILVLPFPGGRHPRIGFLDGAIRPQRETKISVFLPWGETKYVVLDIPEAIRRNDEKTHGLLYLAHTHVDTMWTRQGIDLDPLEWQTLDDGSFQMQRSLPNGVQFGTRVTPARDAVRMQMWLTNGSQEPLSQLRVQNCMMLKGAPEFIQPGDENRVYRESYAACRSAAGGDKWVIVAWKPGARTWGNHTCPCMHSDPQFPDCAPGETQRLAGWLSFYEGSDLDAELERIEATRWWED